MERWTYTLSREHQTPSDRTCGQPHCDEAVPAGQPVPLVCPSCQASGRFIPAPYARAVVREKAAA